MPDGVAVACRAVDHLQRHEERCERAGRAASPETVGARALHGDIAQAQREVVLKAFKVRNVVLSCCTSVTERGVRVAQQRASSTRHVTRSISKALKAMVHVLTSVWRTDAADHNMRNCYAFRTYRRAGLRTMHCFKG